MTTRVLIGGLAFLIIAIGVYLFVQRPHVENDAMERTSMMQGDEVKTMGEGAMQEETATMNEMDAMSGGGSYAEYSPQKVAAVSDGPILLYFHADWCPICRPLDAEFKANTSMLGNLHVFKVNYDTAIELKQKYGVTLQHTFVQIDAKGTMIAKWSDALSLVDVQARVR